MSANVLGIDSKTILTILKATAVRTSKYYIRILSYGVGHSLPIHIEPLS
jgi:hypothetical protein